MTEYDPLTEGFRNPWCKEFCEHYEDCEEYPHVCGLVLEGDD